MGKTIPKWSRIDSGYLAYLEFDVLWRPKYAVSCRIISLFAKSVLSLMDTLAHHQNILVIPLREQNRNDSSVINIATFSKRDHELASLLLSMSHLYVNFVVIERIFDSRKEIRFKVKKTYSIPNSFPRPDVRQLELIFPLHFVCLQNGSVIKDQAVFVISQRK